MTDESGSAFDPADRDALRRAGMNRRLARTAYWLACLGPASLWARAAFYGWLRPGRLPSLPEQIVWWLLCLASPAGVALGAFAFLRIRRNAGFGRGGQYALAAVIVGLLAIPAVVVGTRNVDEMRVILSDSPGRGASCISNIKQLSLALIMYEQDYDEYGPLPANWNRGFMPYLKNEAIYRCPSEEDQAVPSYGLNSRLYRLNLEKVAAPDQVVALFDSIPGRNRAGGIGFLPDPPRHRGGHNVGFLDGHAKWIHARKIAGLAWRPRMEAPKNKQGRQDKRKDKR